MGSLQEPVRICLRVLQRLTPDPPHCEGDVCRTPEELFDHLLVEYKSFVSIQLTKGRREENEADEEQVRRLCQKYLDRREEAMK